MICDRLVQFCQHVYELIDRSQDSLFELMDAVLTRLNYLRRFALEH